MTLLQSIILAIVEGLTEYLPISSTGHLIITSALMGINEEPFTKDFTVIVQFGAILSVLVLYWRRFLTSIDLYFKLLVGFIPAACIGLLLKDRIDLLLGNVQVVAWALIIGGVILIIIDKFTQREDLGAQLASAIGRANAAAFSGESREARALNETKYSFAQAFVIGVFQCLAFVPGVSRSASTIVGGLAVRLNRKSAAEFSFFLAVPTLTAASAYKLLKAYETIQPDQLPMIAIGNVVSFIVGLITIKAFVGYLSRYGFFVFGVYRIIVGAAILGLLYSGHSLRMM
ncbi:MAG: undecaprenyl-diphosphate phosphatase [Bdellovibrionota bacterium]